MRVLREGRATSMELFYGRSYQRDHWSDERYRAESPKRGASHRCVTGFYYRIGTAESLFVRHPATSPFTGGPVQ